MRDQTETPESTAGTAPSVSAAHNTAELDSTTQDAAELESFHAGTQQHDAAELAESEPAENEPEEIAAPEDLGENAHQVVLALLRHQRDLVLELQEVYSRLEQVREVEYAQLRTEVDEALQSVADLPERLTLLQERTDALTASVEEHSALSADQNARISASTADQRVQLAERDARIAALTARLDELEKSAQQTASSVQEAHELLEVLAQETDSSLLHRVTERVSPAAQQAKTTFSKVARRLRR
ncbi:hypothetical protein M3B43_01910 [Nesterenkonia massiliensis]|uniref:Uncharacterized protein n=1 Tax=Nesterenkonia massiliensis TaxID=1232429 RepID=A0ABT2HN33_9MICC|nr:hypothetical protein [Nesterenkonia massiliensis]MCT1606096.1 hypothetical protein [Nesterenkonia massiliensis]